MGNRPLWGSSTSYDWRPSAFRQALSLHRSSCRSVGASRWGASQETSTTTAVAVGECRELAEAELRAMAQWTGHQTATLQCDPYGAGERNATVAALGSGSTVPKRVLLPDIVAVSRYLEEHPDVSRLLPELLSDVLRAFGAGSQVSLSVGPRPEMDGLLAYVRLTEYGDDFLDRLEDFEAAYLDRLAALSGWIIVSSDFAPPES